MQAAAWTRTETWRRRHLQISATSLTACFLLFGGRVLAALLELPLDIVTLDVVFELVSSRLVVPGLHARVII